MYEWPTIRPKSDRQPGGDLDDAHPEEQCDHPHERSRAQHDRDGWNLEF
jgi:hypothetical protein